MQRIKDREAGMEGISLTNKSKAMAKPILVYKTKQRLTLYQIDQLKQAIQSKCEDWLVLVDDNMDTNDVVGLMPDGVSAVAHSEAYKMLFEQGDAHNDPPPGYVK